MAYVESLTAVSALVATDAVAAFLPCDNAVGRDFYPTADAEQAAAGSGTVSSFLPTIKSIYQVSYTDSAGTAKTGSYVMTLTPASGDTVLGPSPLDRIVLPPGARVITATG